MAARLEKDIFARTHLHTARIVSSKDIDVANKRSYESYLGNPCEVEFNFTRTTPEEIVDINSKMKPKSSSGLKHPRVHRFKNKIVHQNA